jgi:hypothetical protein
MNAADIRIRVLRTLGDLRLPTNPQLPLIDVPPTLRPAGEVAVRILILYALTGLANGADGAALRKWLEEGDLYNELMPEERVKFEGALDESDLAEVSWRQESLYALGWAGGLVDALDLPTHECDLTLLFPKIPPEVDTQEFIRALNLRTAGEILYQADLHYCLHWALRHPAKILRSRAARQLNRDVIIERRQALEWLISPHRWNDIPLDT